MITFFLFLRPHIFCLSGSLVSNVFVLASRSLCAPQHLVLYLSDSALLIPALSTSISTLFSLQCITFPQSCLSSPPFLNSNWIPLNCQFYFLPVTPFSLFPPNLTGMLPSDPLQSQYDSWLSLVDHLNIKAFVNLTLANSVRHGIQHLLFISGLG